MGMIDIAVDGVFYGGQLEPQFGDEEQLVNGFRGFLRRLHKDQRMFKALPAKFPISTLLHGLPQSDDKLEKSRLVQARMTEQN
jgi:hypothetical protein